MKYLAIPLLALATPAFANSVDIVGNVAAKCVIQTTKTGAYGPKNGNGTYKSFKNLKNHG